MDHRCEDRRDYYENDYVTIIEDPHLRPRLHHHANHYYNPGNSLSFPEKPVILDDNCFRGGERYRVIDEKYDHGEGLFGVRERYRVIDEKHGHGGGLFGGGERHRVIDEKYGHGGGLFDGGENRIKYIVEEADYFVEDGHREIDCHRRQ